MQQEFSGMTTATATITTSISHITAEKKKSRNMKILGMESLGCFFHSHSANSSKGEKKSWITHLIQSKQVLRENNKINGWIWDQHLLLVSYPPCYEIERKNRGQDGKGLCAGAGCTACSYTLLLSIFCPCLWQTVEIVHKVKRLPATFKPFLGSRAPKYPQVKYCGAVSCLCQFSCIRFLVLALHWY